MADGPLDRYLVRHLVTGRGPRRGAARAARRGGPTALAAPALVPLAVLALLVGPAPAAGAAPRAPEAVVSSADLREQVDTLRAEVERLEVAAETAVEDYNTVQAEVDALAAAEVDAQVALDDADRRLAADRAAANRRVRALYRAGGHTEISWAAVAGSLGTDLGPAGLADQVATFRTARTVLDADARVVERARAHVEVAVAGSGAVQDLRRDRAAAEERAEAGRRAAEAALREHEVLLATTDTALVEAVERERQQEEAEALARALAAAQARALEDAAGAAAAQAAAAAAVATPVGGWPPLPAGAPGPSGLSGLSGDARRQAELVGAGESAGGLPAGARLPEAQAVAAVERAAAAAPTPQAAAALRAAGSRLGLPYVWGATGPGTFDCSGLTMWSYRQAGVAIPRTSRQQYAGLRKVAVADMLPGDLLFYASGSQPGSIHHVSMYLGDGLMVTAPRTGDVVKVSALWSKAVYGAVRPVG
ncbi:C40 family peptidase [Aquipuribacter sp. SD81]|uniref:C40 family peptidase n=1 Tax=Aquipuribacter sp. SD81 TaxID=3127703 RepID=UPI00301889BF